MSFSRIPSELIRAVAAQLVREADINALAQTSRRFYDIVDKYLYRSNRNTKVRSALAWAAGFGRLATAKKALRLGANIKACWGTWEPLHAAVANGHGDVVELLLEHGALPNKEEGGLLCEAAGEGHGDVVALLIRHGLEVDGQSFICETPLMAAATFAHESVVVLLLRLGANPHPLEADARSPLMCAAQGGSVACTELILRQGVDVNHHRNNYESALYWAVRKGHTGVIEVLLRNGAHIDRLPLFATAVPLLHFVRLFIDYGFDIETRSAAGLTLLSRAADELSEECLKLLLQNGADINTRDIQGLTPVMRACGRGDEAVVQPLLEHGATIEVDRIDHMTLNATISTGAYELVEMYLRAGIDVNLRAPNGYTPLIMAATNDDENITHLLIEKGAMLDVVNNNGESALIVAAQKDFQDIANLLLYSGADACIRDVDGETVLFKAAMHGNNRLITGVLDMGILHVDDTNDDGHTVLSVAAEFGQTELAKLLIERGADPNHRDNSG
ncbi:Ankyrin repeat domain-containing protein 50 [Cladobotryum mycophilum]|uniref:Ankyrin repeat domain-containing protein 50 n=1 Tax=Cladobotryum mycophilum TaxID=491253 RepID=A0ABR0S5Z2_9HYPO